MSTETAPAGAGTSATPPAPPGGSRAVRVAGVVLVAVVWVSAALFGAYILDTYGGALAEQDLVPPSRRTVGRRAFYSSSRRENLPLGGLVEVRIRRGGRAPRR